MTILEKVFPTFKDGKPNNQHKLAGQAGGMAIKLIDMHPQGEETYKARVEAMGGQRIKPFRGWFE